MNPYRIPEGSPWFHVVNVSGGRSSGLMLASILHAHGGTLPPRTVAAFANTGRERPETLDFVQAMSDQWGVPITWVEFDYDPHGKAGTKYVARVVTHETASRNGEPFDAMFDSGAWLPSVKKRTCTSMLKVETIDRYMWSAHKLTKRQTRKLIGFRFDEPARWKPALYRECAVSYPMVEAGVTKGDVASFWASQPFDLRIRSEFGNCDLCYLKSRSTLLSTLRDKPELAGWWVETERRAGRTFRAGESFEALRDAALAPSDSDEIGRPTAVPGSANGARADGQPELPLPCFCGD